MVQECKRQESNSKTIYNIAAGPKYDLIAKWIGKNKRVLDVGCGAGEFSKRLAVNGNHVIGVESSEENYGIARKKIEVYLGDFLKINIGERFDIVLFGDVLEHMHSPDAAMRKARKLADEIILCVPNFDFWGVRCLKFFGVKKMRSGILDKNHVYFFNKVIIENMIEDIGLEIVDFSSPAPKKFPRLYNDVIRTNHHVFGYQFIYKCRVNNR